MLILAVPILDSSSWLIAFREPSYSYQIVSPTKDLVFYFSTQFDSTLSSNALRERSLCPKMLDREYSSWSVVVVLKWIWSSRLARMVPVLALSGFDLLTDFVFMCFGWLVHFCLLLISTMIAVMLSQPRPWLDARSVAQQSSIKLDIPASNYCSVLLLEKLFL